MNIETTKNDPSRDKKNDPWLDHLEIQFGPVYPFFQNHEWFKCLMLKGDVKNGVSKMLSSLHEEKNRNEKK